MGVLAAGVAGAPCIWGGCTNSGRSPDWAQAAEREPANRQAARPGNARGDMTAAYPQRLMEG